MPGILMTMSNLHHDSSSSSLPSLDSSMTEMAVPFLFLLILLTGLTIGFLFLACLYFKRKKRLNAYVYRRLPMTWSTSLVILMLPPKSCPIENKSLTVISNDLPISCQSCPLCLFHQLRFYVISKFVVQSFKFMSLKLNVVSQLGCFICHAD